MYTRFTKPGFDICVSLAAIICLLPFLLIIAIVLLIVNNGRIFFMQERIGLNDKPFNIIKFRTMKDIRSAEGSLLADSIRLTPTGRWIRDWSIDELPQLLNVLKGEMSLIGPRPLLPEYLGLYNETQAMRHKVKPGLTGWAQINGRNAISWEQKFILDIFYVNNESFLLDIKILCMTLSKIMLRSDVNSSKLVPMEPFKGTVN